MGVDVEPIAVGAGRPGSAPPADRRPLNLADRTLLAIDRTLRWMGAGGFDTQTFVWLDGRADLARLRHALVRLNLEHPASTARLVEPGGRGEPYWRMRPGAVAELSEASLESATEQAVLDHASRLLSSPSDPAEADPLRFYLLHRPDGRDVLLTQFNHILMDHSDVVRVLRALELYDRDPAEVSPRGRAEADLMRVYLSRFSLGRRRAALRRAAEWPRMLTGGAVQMVSNSSRGGGPLRIANRTVDPTATSAFQARVRAIGGTPGLSMALLASAFRALARVAAPNQKRARYFAAGIGIDLGLARGSTPVWQNMASMVPIVASPEELHDRDRLAGQLARQLRLRLATDMDLGTIEMARLITRRESQGRWAIELLLRYCESFWYGFFANVDSIGDHFCGAKIDRVFSAGICWAPVGLTLLANQYGGRLCIQATYLPHVVSEPLVNTFLDLLVDDLIA